MEAALLGRRDLLNRLTIDLHERRAQRLVANDDRIESAPQCGTIERPDQTHPAANVVRGADSVELIDEPQPLLRKRQLQRPVAVDSLDRRKAVRLSIQLIFPGEPEEGFALRYCQFVEGEC